MPNEYRLSYPCDLYVSIQADSLDEAEKKLIQVLEPVSDGIIVCLETPKGFADPEERLYPRTEDGRIIKDEISLEDGPCEDEDDEETAVEGGPAVEGTPEAAGGGEAGTGA